MRTTLVLFLFLPLFAVAQLSDDFSDGDFTGHPAWWGTDSCFIVNSSLQLQSAATDAGLSFLSVATGPIGPEAEWRFWIRENFSPSGNNYAVVWLSADTADLTLASQGYCLRFGAPGNQDAIELYRQDPTEAHLICRGHPAAIASSFKAAVKVIRDREGHWSLFSDFDGQGVYSLEAEGDDDTYIPGGYFGFQLCYTSSNAKKFYFDDVYAGPVIVDHTPPSLLALEAVDAWHLLLSFDEALDLSALAPQHFYVTTQILDPETIHPDSVGFGERPSQLWLVFAEALPENVYCQLHVTGICDLAGNVMPDAVSDFSIYQPGPNDVVVNEIMADPSPVVGLPEWEYLELFNTTEIPVDLKDWTLTVGNAEKTFPSVTIAPQGYLILCKESGEEELRPYGPVLSFSSFSIANAGTTLRLSSPAGTTVSELSFNDTWYHDAEKKDGGWSLEQIDPFNPCAGTMNWSASTDPSGGTPGRLNSIDAPNELQPRVERASMLGDRIVFLWFDQQMDLSSLQAPERYRVLELDQHPAEVVCNPVTHTSVQLLFDQAFQEGTLYTLAVQDVLSCSGQPIEPETQVRFGIPNPIAAGEVLINEILFDPIAPGVDYVELYNVSDLAFDLSELRLGVIRESFPNPADTTLKVITDDSFLLLPHTYLLLSTDAATVGSQYGCAIPDVLDMASFPPFPNSGGTVLLISRQGVVVDQMSFSESMHYPLLKETKGVSLERVSWAAPSWQPDNWHSAAAAVGYGTPGYANSMAQQETGQDPDGASAAQVVVTPEVFSPDGDGVDDQCVFSYDLAMAGVTMNTYIFNVEGQLVRHLVKGELVEREGSFVWNGLDQKGRRVPLGMYIAVTEVFSLGDGTVRRFKNAVVVASR